jgi:hypothetical protein
MRNIKSKISIVLVFLIFFTGDLLAQRDFGNEWINYNQRYFKVAIAEDGVYKLTGQDLQDAGIPISTIQPQKLQMWYRGKAYPFSINSTDTLSIKTSDVIFFYGTKNDGRLDSTLYSVQSSHRNKYISLYSDTNFYFVTWNAIDDGLQFTEKQTPSNLSSTGYYLKRVTQTFEEIFNINHPTDPKNKFYPSDYGDGIGWTSSEISRNNQRTYELKTPNVFNAQNFNPLLDFVIHGASDFEFASPDHHLIVSISSDNNTFTQVFDTIYNGYRTIAKKISINPSFLQGGSVYVRVRSNGVGANNIPDVHRISYLSVVYPKTYTLPDDVNYVEEIRHLPNLSPQNSVVSFNVNSIDTDWRLMNFNDNNIIIPDFSNNQAHFATSLTDNENRLVVFNQKLSKQIASIKEIKMIDYISLSNNSTYWIVSHTSLKESAEEYKAYRETGNPSKTYKTAIAYADELYDQFFYGHHHPAALQNFFHYIYKQSTVKPEYAMLLGKGIATSYFRPVTRENMQYDLVPTIGVPTADIMMVTGIDNGFAGYDSVLVPLIKIGRVSAFNNEQVRNYLNKVKEYENKPYVFDDKTILHVPSGGNPDEFALNDQAMSRAENIIKNKFTGLDVKKLESVSSELIDLANKDNIIRIINEGVSMYSFLGHGSPTQPGVEFGYASEYDNEGKYPIMYLNGCGIGDCGVLSINDSLTARAENFLVRVPKRGAVGWLAHSERTSQGTLAQQIDFFYKVLADENFDGTITDGIKQMIENLTKAGSLTSVYNRALVLQLVYQGDPVLEFPFNRHTDYVLNTEKVYVSPEDVIATQDSMILRIVVENWGKTNTDDFEIKIERRLSNGTVINYPIKSYPHIIYRDTIEYLIPIKNNEQGINEFAIEIDPNNKILEKYKDNNRIIFDFFLQGTGARLMFPENYGIVDTIHPSLILQSRNINEGDVEGFIEIDTVPNFNSPFLIKSPLLTTPNLKIWNPTLLNKDSVVYYWRGRLNLPEDLGGEWYQRSFTYIKGSENGWSQSYFPQLLEQTQFIDVVVDTPNRKIDFTQSFQGYEYRATPFSTSGMGFYVVGGGPINPGSCGGPITFLYQLNRFDYWLDDGTRIFRRCNGSSGVFYRMFNLTLPNVANKTAVVQGRDSFLNIIKNLPLGNAVMVGTRPGSRNFNLSGWDSAFRDYLVDSVGLEIFRNNTANDSLMYFFIVEKTKKGWKIWDQQFFKDSNTTFSGIAAGDGIFRTNILNAPSQTGGSLLSGEIGPAQSWREANIRYYPLDSPSYAHYYHHIYGITRDRQTIKLYDSILDPQFAINTISAADFPFIQIESFFSDTVDRIASQLKDWTIYYEGTPEGTIVLNENFRVSADTLQQGDTISFGLDFVNISRFAFDSIFVDIVARNEQNSVVASIQKYMSPLVSNDTLRLREIFSTDGLEGRITTTININHKFEQPEVTLDNNRISFSFFVLPEDSLPKLDVTVNNKYVKDKEIIPANSIINISLKDENPFYTLDTSNLKVWFNREEAEIKRIPMDSDIISITPATPQNNLLKVDMELVDLESGVYLLQVDGEDVSKNKIGNSSYKVRLRVYKENRISQILPYPNPAQFYVNFNFVAYGDDLMDEEYEIWIYNNLGEVVGHIDKSKFGNVTLGENTVVWDVTQVPSGVYFYKVYKLSNREFIEQRIPNINEQNFNGKIVIVK